MHNAVTKRDPAYDGVFIVAIKTTGIFCRPTCPSKESKKQNREFFNSTKDAILAGYRACKRCKPLEKIGETPTYIKKIMQELQDDPSLKLKDWHLRERNIEPATIRRWFLKNHGMTFHGYQRMLRINTAFKKINGGESVINTAYDSGYDSLSGFADSFKNVLGIAPSNSKTKQIIDIRRIETPLGVMFGGATKEGVCLLEFTDRRMFETQLKKLTKYLNASFSPGKNKHLDQLEKELNEYFEGKRKTFSVTLHTPGTSFQQQVWKQLQTIPYGKTRSYVEQANAIKMPKAVRAVANANGMNRIAIIIPCHRVIGSNGQLTGYGGGLWRKRKLLDLEKSFS